MYSIKFVPPKNGDYIGGFSKAGFETRAKAFEWLLENNCCDDCQNLYKNKGQVYLDCLQHWDIFLTEGSSVNLKEIPDFCIETAKIFLEALGRSGVSKQQIQFALQDMYDISCKHSRDINSNLSKYWARIALTIEKVLF